MQHLEKNKFSNNIHITTPIYYVNDVPHIGHAYTNIVADVTSRFMKMCDVYTLFTTGTDEHGSKIEKIAKEKKILVSDYVFSISEEFKLLAKNLNIKYDNFIRTTDMSHKKAVLKLWNILNENGYIYLGKYCGWYSVRDEAFYNEDELINGQSPTGAPVEWLEEPTYFFKLSSFKDKLLNFYQNNHSFIYPKNRRNEIINMLKRNINDLSISRVTCKWGIKVPKDEEHTIYVWLDALTNYLTALGYPDNFDYFMFENTIHFIGKDILRFHAIYWPAFLIAANLPLPKRLAVHGWWLNDGEKISKSLGNVINPNEIISEFGLDQVRYFLLREISFGSDGNFSRSSLINRVNSELANNIGNLIQRTLSLIIKYCSGMIPQYNNIEKITTMIYDSVGLFVDNMLDQKFNDALEIIISASSRANEYINDKKPWETINNDRFFTENVLFNLTEIIRCIGILLQPFIPDSATKILNMISIPESERNIKNVSEKFCIRPTTNINNLNIIFPRLIM